MKRESVLLLLSLLAAGCWFDSADGTRPITPVKEPEKTLYERLGKEKGIAKIVDEWVARSVNDPQVNFTRKGTGTQWVPADSNTAKLKGGLVQFLSATSGGSQQYEGRDMKSVHQGMQISGGEFDAMKKDLKETLKMLKMQEKEQRELLKMIEAVRRDLVEVP
ncbi:MAG TPA: group 1 truncated hemoglobin [Tepidisphaeraceae bacterium]|nr:group 1 truncated hemoglobin [Tepidisphaeraceae bacterium]